MIVILDIMREIDKADSSPEEAGFTLYPGRIAAGPRNKERVERLKLV
jgi:hypothetical protein